MAPSLPVYSRQELKDNYPHLFPEVVEGADGKKTLDLENCKLWSLTQNQCTFDGDRTVCIPFKRVFARCKDTEYSSKRELTGYKLFPEHTQKKSKEVYRNIEITTEKDNDYTTKDKLLEEFFEADKVLKRKMDQFYAEIMKESERSWRPYEHDSAPNPFSPFSSSSSSLKFLGLIVRIGGSLHTYTLDMEF
ncbi:hypothetical protein OGAPHI_006581 [Ogataea philodendri]|uniref:Uncharacterized protein n=1 Tax=Ogataea philodendri TaxID=1378263 RepID=A0A9P8T0H5_9ASCO|nr:uncharacterized protein OGAPHI_006581 [Ogataea philodendri]KAH3661174.1 hypothetical protein OGAPHI_006581 [Ogataea philodendri]